LRPMVFLPPEKDEEGGTLRHWVLTNSLMEERCSHHSSASEWRDIEWGHLPHPPTLSRDEPMG
jgi:hypothetical protein